MTDLKIIILLAAFLAGFTTNAQRGKSIKQNLVYVDNKGVLRWQKNNQEAAFFGVNYTAPFAFAYRAHRALNIDLEKAIQADVYHMARLGFDAFRVHVWDIEISDTAGNLLQNEHLRLFDFLLAELKKRNIKTVITPIAFWGNGYPEKDENTPGFSRKYGKGGATANDTAIKAQENYLKQFFSHLNPYTKLTYKDDPDVIAVEINNEPSHSGTKEFVTAYINRLAASIKSTGWTKPVYYNISQSPYYADAVAKAAIDGVSFQWYPTGLVANNTLHGNYLPNVDKYTIPFDTIPGYSNKSLMVYEFDAADLLQSTMYPAMVRSFREAGFQWATQFAYDPMAIANVNTEYQTHYLNLAYTPSKAISMLIAARAFHKLPRKKSYGSYPADSAFDVFRVSHKEALSEMNSTQEFYYSNNTASKPVDINKLANLAGVGSSVIVDYSGAGAYFLDKIEDGVWRLELMPDAFFIKDPFEKPSPKKEVTRIQWQTNNMKIMLPNLGAGFSVRGLNKGNNFSLVAANNAFQIRPGTYLLTRAGKTFSSGTKNGGTLGLNEFFAPQTSNNEIFVRHEPFTEVSSGKSLLINAIVVGVDTERVSLQVNRLGEWPSKLIAMNQKSAGNFTAELPAELLRPGMFSYRIIVQRGNEYVTFPANRKENPYAWDSYNSDTWKTFIAAENGSLALFNATRDQKIKVYSSQRALHTTYTTTEKPGQLVLKLAATQASANGIIGFQNFVADKLRERSSEHASFDKLVIRAKTTNPRPSQLKIILITKDAVSFSAEVKLSNQFENLAVPLSELKIDSFLILPRPYPGFMPLWFKAANTGKAFQLSEVESLQVIAGYDAPGNENQATGLEVETIWLEKRK